ncbi:hypothetical protein IF2G_04318 [Cordyceps javanica]|nr:hypothetical protein IF2G_04318 [Cordyceps javanica]
MVKTWEDSFLTMSNRVLARWQPLMLVLRKPGGNITASAYGSCRLRLMLRTTAVPVAGIGVLGPSVAQ